jgi:hypothetical protein
MYFRILKRSTGIQTVCSADFAAGLHGWEYQFSAWIPVVAEHFLELEDLEIRQTLLRGIVFTEDSGGVKFTQRRILDDAVLDIIDCIALPKDFIVDPRLPGCGGNEVQRGVGAGDGEEMARHEYRLLKSTPGAPATIPSKSCGNFSAFPMP